MEIYLLGCIPAFICACVYIIREYRLRKEITVSDIASSIAWTAFSWVTAGLTVIVLFVFAFVWLYVKGEEITVWKKK